MKTKFLAKLVKYEYEKKKHLDKLLEEIKEKQEEVLTLIDEDVVYFSENNERMTFKEKLEVYDNMVKKEKTYSELLLMKKKINKKMSRINYVLKWL